MRKPDNLFWGIEWRNLLKALKKHPLTEYIFRNHEDIHGLDNRIDALEARIQKIEEGRNDDGR